MSEVERLQSELEQLAAAVPLAAPWTAPTAEDLDRQTLDAWLVANARDDVALVWYRDLAAALFTAEGAEMSLLHFLFYVASNGMLDNMVVIGGGNPEARVVGGSHRISERMAEELGDAVRLRAPVHSVAHDERGVTVAFDGGEVTARHALVTLPPALAGRLRYRPPLPAVRDALTQQVPMGSVIKVQVAYETPFWRDEGLSGFAQTLDEPLGFTLDNSPPDGSYGVLVGFFVGARARAAGAMSRDARRSLVVDTLTRFFGPHAASPSEYVEKDWAAEEYTRGCYGGRLGTGVWTQYGRAPAEPVGRIHWAGAESADVSNGYMDGAVRAGRRAAAEIRASLSS